MIEISLKDIDEKLKTRLNQFKDKDYVFLWTILALEIILNTLGREWLITYCTPESTQRDNLPIKRGDSEDKRYNKQHRIIYLGHLLYSLKDCDGFETFIESLKTRDLESGNWEMSVAARFLESGFKIRFIKESGIKKQDYDLLISTQDLEFQVEAKNLINSTNNEKALTNILGKARKQLPRDGNGVIYSLIPSKWAEQEGANEIIGNVVNSFLRNTKRVKFVIIDWHQWINLGTEGRAVAKNFLIYNNLIENVDFNLQLKSVDPNNPILFTPSYIKNLA